SRCQQDPAQRLFPDAVGGAGRIRWAGTAWGALQPLQGALVFGRISPDHQAIPSGLATRIGDDRFLQRLGVAVPVATHNRIPRAHGDLGRAVRGDRQSITAVDAVARSRGHDTAGRETAEQARGGGLGRRRRGRKNAVLLGHGYLLVWSWSTSRRSRATR